MTQKLKEEAVATADPAASTALVQARPVTGMGFVSDDIDIPRLNVIQKMSEIEGTLGSVVYDKDFELLQPEQKAKVIIVGAIKKWKEDTPFDSDVMPKFASTQAEADALAAQSSYGVQETADIIMLVPQQGDDDTNYPYPIGYTNYLIAKITVQKDAYRLTYKRLFTFQTFNKNVPVASRFWNFGSELISKGKYSWYTPTLSMTKEDAPVEALEFIEQLTSQC